MLLHRGGLRSSRQVHGHRRRPSALPAGPQVLALAADALGVGRSGEPGAGPPLPALPDVRDLLAPAPAQPGPDPVPDPTLGLADLLPALAVCDLLPADQPLPAVLLAALDAALARHLLVSAPAGPEAAAATGRPSGDAADAGPASTAAGASGPAAGGPAGLAALAGACLGGACGPGLAPCAAWTPRLAAMVLSAMLRACNAAAPGSAVAAPMAARSAGSRAALGAALRGAAEAAAAGAPARLAATLGRAGAGAADAADVLAAAQPLQARRGAAAPGPRP